MKTFKQLTDLDRTVLFIWGRELDYSTTAHFTLQKIKKRIKSQIKILDKDLKRSMKTLINSGFFVKHPTGRSTTYHLSPKGRRCSNIVKRENEENI